MSIDTLTQHDADLQALLEVEVREAWFLGHPGAKDDGAVVGVLRGPGGEESFLKILDGVATEIDRAEYSARAWWAARKRRS